MNDAPSEEPQRGHQSSTRSKKSPPRLDLARLKHDDVSKLESQRDITFTSSPSRILAEQGTSPMSSPKRLLFAITHFGRSPAADTSGRLEKRKTLSDMSLRSRFGALGKGGESHARTLNVAGPFEKAAMIPSPLSASFAPALPPTRGKKTIRRFSTSTTSCHSVEVLVVSIHVSFHSRGCWLTYCYFFPSRQQLTLWKTEVLRSSRLQKILSCVLLSVFCG